MINQATFNTPWHDWEQTQCRHAFVELLQASFSDKYLFMYLGQQFGVHEYSVHRIHSRSQKDIARIILDGSTIEVCRLRGLSRQKRLVVSLGDPSSFLRLESWFRK